MGSRGMIYYRGVPVPYSVSWTGEKDAAGQSVGLCPHMGLESVLRIERRGDGKPCFKDPHPVRQRELITNDLCDVCARPLKNRTKVSLSQARPQMHAVNSGDVLQVEPLLHKECAAVSMRHCPGLKNHAEIGILKIRHVTRHAHQYAVFSAEGVFQLTGVRRQAIYYAKVQLIKWREKDLNWLKK